MTLSPDLLRKMDAYFRAQNYLSAGQIYLQSNPLLREPLLPKHFKPRLLGHWGTCPGINFINLHLDLAIKNHDATMMLVVGPGHGAPAVLANAYLEGTYSKLFPNITEDARGLEKFFRQFSYPGGIPSHSGAETPGSIHEGGELGYSLAHAFGAVLDNPELVAACIVGDGEAETGPLAASWHSNKFSSPRTSGAVLPILHLNGAKIAGPTFLARIPHDELAHLMEGYGWMPLFVEGDDPHALHQPMFDAVDRAMTKIKEIQRNPPKDRPIWPMIVLRTPKGWTGPKEIDGKPIEGTFRSHQVPIDDLSKREHRDAVERWLRSYHPEELFDDRGKLGIDTSDILPRPEKRLSASPYANSGCLRDLDLPDYRAYAVEIPAPGSVNAESTRVQGKYIRDVIKQNPKSFLVVSPDETASNRWTAVFEVTDRVFEGTIEKTDDHVAHEGRVMEVLSEHLCQGWLEGYLLTGRHGFFSCYEAFIHIVDSMFNQHAKWLKVSKQVPWRRPISSLNYLLTSHVWRQDHNGFSHQDPGFIDHVVNKKAEIIRVYLPPDANTLLAVTDECLRSKDCVNVIVAGKQNEPQWLSMDRAIKHVANGIGIWEFASTDKDREPDVVMACAGDVPTLETLAAVRILHDHFPDLAIRVINVVDLMKLQPRAEHPHGLTDRDFDALFTKDKPVIFAFHGYPWAIHRLAYKRTNHVNFHVRGYKEEGTTTTPFDMTVLNDLDRFHLAEDAIDRLPIGARAAYFKQWIHDKLTEHRAYIREHGEDMPEVRDWRWTALE